MHTYILIIELKNATLYTATIYLCRDVYIKYISTYK